MLKRHAALVVSFVLSVMMSSCRTFPGASDVKENRFPIGEADFSIDRQFSGVVSFPMGFVGIPDANRNQQALDAVRAMVVNAVSTL